MKRAGGCRSVPEGARSIDEACNCCIHISLVTALLQVSIASCVDAAASDAADMLAVFLSSCLFFVACCSFSF